MASPGVSSVTLVSSVAGQGTEHAYHAVKPEGHATIGLEYASWLAHSATIALSEVRVVRLGETEEEDVVHSIRYVPRDPEKSKKTSPGSRPT